MNGCVAVFDIGKTNIKLVVFDRGGAILAERSAPNAPLEPDAAWPYLRLDTCARMGFPDWRAQGRRRALFHRGDLDCGAWRGGRPCHR